MTHNEYNSRFQGAIILQYRLMAQVKVQFIRTNYLRDQTMQSKSAATCWCPLEYKEADESLIFQTIVYEHYFLKMSF